MDKKSRIQRGRKVEEDKYDAFLLITIRSFSQLTYILQQQNMAASVVQQQGGGSSFQFSQLYQKISGHLQVLCTAAISSSRMSYFIYLLFLLLWKHLDLQTNSQKFIRLSLANCLQHLQHCHSCLKCCLLYHQNCRQLCLSKTLFTLDPSSMWTSPSSWISKVSSVAHVVDRLTVEASILLQAREC